MEQRLCWAQVWAKPALGGTFHDPELQGLLGWVGILQMADRSLLLLQDTLTHGVRFRDASHVCSRGCVVGQTCRLPCMAQLCWCSVSSPWECQRWV